MLAFVHYTMILGTLSYPLSHLYFFIKWYENNSTLETKLKGTSYLAKLRASLSFLCSCKDDSCLLLPYVFAEKAIKRGKNNNMTLFHL